MGLAARVGPDEEHPVHHGSKGEEYRGHCSQRVPVGDCCDCLNCGCDRKEHSCQKSHRPDAHDLLLSEVRLPHIIIRVVDYYKKLLLVNMTYTIL